MRPDESLGYWLTQTMRSVANAFSDVLQTACATLGKPYMITPPQWFALSSLSSSAWNSMAWSNESTTGLITVSFGFI